MIKKPLKTTPVYTVPDDCVSLDDLELTGHMVERITRSKIGLRKIITFRLLTK